MENQRKFGAVIAKAWTDPVFKERLINSPHEVLREHDIHIPEGAEVKILEDNDSVKHFVLPNKPEDDTAPSMMLDSKYCM